MESRPVTIEVGFRSGSSCDDEASEFDDKVSESASLTIRCQSLRP